MMNIPSRTASWKMVVEFIWLLPLGSAEIFVLLNDLKLNICSVKAIIIQQYINLSPHFSGIQLAATFKKTITFMLIYIVFKSLADLFHALICASDVDFTVYVVFRQYLE